MVNSRPTRWLRFSLRTVLVSVLILSMPLAWVAKERRSISERRKALSSASISLNTVDHQPVWRIWLLGDDEPKYATGMFTYTRGIEANDDKLNDATMAYLEGLTQLKTCRLKSTQVTNVGVSHLRPLKNLEWLCLIETQLSDTGMVYVAGLTQLQSLDLTGTQITDAGLAYVEGLSHLESLDLSFTKVTDAGLAHLQGLKHLRKLSLKGTGITDAGLSYLERLANLEELNLERTQITDASLIHFKRMGQLRFIKLTDALVTLEGFLEIRSSVSSFCFVQHEALLGRAHRKLTKPANPKTP